MLYPHSGGSDFRGATVSHEKNCVNLDDCNGFSDVVNVKKLCFYSLKNDEDIGYFYIETNDLSPTGIYKNISTLGSEQVMYVEEEDKCYDMAEYDYTLRWIYTTNLLLYIIGG